MICLTENCGILKKFLPGDVILVDRGFNISESIGMIQASLQITSHHKREIITISLSEIVISSSV